MKKYLAFYETEWPANIAELTAVENKPFVGYLKGEGVLYTVAPKPIVFPPNGEIWYTTTDGEIYDIESAQVAVDQHCKLLGYDDLYITKTVDSNEFNKDLNLFVIKSSKASLLGTDYFIYGYGTAGLFFSGNYSARNLKSIYLSESVSIEYEGLDTLSNLTDIYYGGTIEKWNKISAYIFDCPKLAVIHCADGDITDCEKYH